jgi:hypothetical protein
MTFIEPPGFVPKNDGTSLFRAHPTVSLPMAGARSDLTLSQAKLISYLKIVNKQGDVNFTGIARP